MNNPPSSFGDRVRAARNQLAKSYVNRRLQRRDFTIISDDCWAGRLYSDLRLKTHSPFISMGFTAREYLDFLCKMREPGALDVLSVSSEERGYPIIQTRYARLFGLHYSSDEEFRARYERRCKSILWDRLFIKIDFGNPKYRPEDLARWNELKLPNSLAFYSPDCPFNGQYIHNGLLLPDWVPDGDRKFPLSIRRFDLFSWLNTGRIHCPLSYRIPQFLLVEKMFLPRCRDLVRSALRLRLS